MAKKRKLPILSVVPAGSPDEFPRFLISDARNRLWDGQNFSSTGILYSAHNDAAIDVQAILKTHFEGVEPVRYVVPVFVDVFAHEPVLVAEVAKYLSASSRLNLNTTEHGNGPGNALVLPWIDWSRIE